MKFDSKKINLFMRGTDAIIAIPMDMVDGELADARAEVAHVFGCDLAQVTADMRNPHVPPNMFYVWRIKRYTRPARLRQPGSQLFVSWDKINVIPDRPKPEAEEDVIDTSSIRKVGGKVAKAEAKGGEYVTRDELVRVVKAQEKMLLELTERIEALTEILTRP